MKHICALIAAIIAAGILSTGVIAQNRGPQNKAAAHRDVHKEFQELEKRYMTLLNEHEALLDQTQKRYDELGKAHLDRNRIKDQDDKRKVDALIDRLNNANRDSTIRIARIGLEMKKLDLAMARLSRFDSHLIEGNNAGGDDHHDNDDRRPRVTGIDVVRTFRDASGKTVISYKITYSDGAKRNFDQVVGR